MLHPGRESFIQRVSNLNFVKRKKLDDGGDDLGEQNLYKRDLMIINQKLEQISQGTVDEPIVGLIERIGHVAFLGGPPALKYASKEFLPALIHLIQDAEQG